MPSPFPGMDPYLENPDDFPGLHDFLINALLEQLQPLLPSTYRAKTCRRVWIEYPRRSCIPDVAILTSDGPARLHPETPYGGSSHHAAATMEETGAVVVEADPEYGEEVYELTLEIVRRDSPDEPARLVTSIEILSPSNKWRSGGGRGDYLRKQRELLRQDVQLVEIDLLRSGEHTTAVPERQLVAEAGRFDYHVSVRDFASPHRFFVYPIRLEEPLPRIGIPLLPDDGVRFADLQSIFHRSYDALAFDREVNYDANPPDPPLSEDRLNWVRERIERRRNTSQP